MLLVSRMTYRDTTFCNAKCMNYSCAKNWDLERDDYKAQDAKGFVSLADLSRNCIDYLPEALGEP